MATHVLIFAAFFFATSLYALVRGGQPERILTIAFLLAYVIAATNPHSAQNAYEGVEWRLVWPDIAILIVLIWITIASCRYWPVLMTSMQSFIVLGHFAKAVDPSIISVAYYLIVAWGAWPMVALLAFATWFQCRRCRRFGVSFDWVQQLPPAYHDGWHAHERSNSGAKTGSS